jgi:hypothetical protein
MAVHGGYADNAHSLTLLPSAALNSGEIQRFSCREAPPTIGATYYPHAAKLTL